MNKGTTAGSKLRQKQRCADSQSKPIWGWSDGGEWSTQAAKCIRPSNTKE